MILWNYWIISISLTSFFPFEWGSFKVWDIIEPSTLCLHFINLCFTTTAVCSKTVCYIATFFNVEYYWLSDILRKKTASILFYFLCTVKRDNSFCMCVCFLRMTYNTSFLRKEASDVGFSFTIMENIWWVNHVKSFVGKSWSKILI